MIVEFRLIIAMIGNGMGRIRTRSFVAMRGWSAQVEEETLSTRRKKKQKKKLRFVDD